MDFITTFYFWCGHTSGMTVIHVLCLTLRQSTNNWCLSPSQPGPYLRHCHYRNCFAALNAELVLICEHIWQKCLESTKGCSTALEPKETWKMVQPITYLTYPNLIPVLRHDPQSFEDGKKKKPERSGHSVIQIFLACKLTCLHWINKSIICVTLGTSPPLLDPD